MTLYDGPRHAPFELDAIGARRGTVLLLHGFTGTPAELRPLARELADAGLAVRVPLLPGFGADFDSLGSRSMDDWLAAARDEWHRLQRRNKPWFLGGYSMGAALAMHLAVTEMPDRLVLLAPFLRIESRLVPLIPVAKFLLPRISLFGNADFADPATRETFAAIDPALDLDDPDVQDRLRRDTSFPLVALRQLQRVATGAAKLAPRITTPVTIVQGTRDQTASLRRSRELARRFRGPVEMVEVDSDHHLIRPGRDTWPVVVQAVLDGLLGPGPGSP